MGDHKIRCWQCDARLALAELEDCDGICPACNAEISLYDYLGDAMDKVATLEAEFSAFKTTRRDALEKINKASKAAEQRVIDLEAENAKLRAELERRVPDGWPLLERQAKVGAGTFAAGLSARLVVEAAYRQHEYATKPPFTDEQIKALAKTLAAPRRPEGDAATILLPALRQYMHNDGSGLLAGYEYERTQQIVAELREECERLRNERETFRKGLACMLFAFDDGVGMEWSEPLLNWARKLTPAEEYKQ